MKSSGDADADDDGGEADADDDGGEADDDAAASVCA